MKSRTVLAIPAATVVALAVTLGVSACNPLAAVTEQVAEQAIEDATGGSIDIDAGGGVSIPADFPADIPLLDAKLFSATTLPMGDAKTWTLIFSVSDPSAAFSAASADLTAAGYQATLNSETAEGSFASFDNGTWNILLTAAPGVGSEQALLSYVVSPSAIQ